MTILGDLVLHSECVKKMPSMKLSLASPPDFHQRQTVNDPKFSMKHLVSRILAPSLLAAVALGLSACATTSSSGRKDSFSFDPPVKQPSNPSAVSVRLSTGAGRVYVVEGDQVLLASPASVGKASSPTPMGTYTINSKTKTRRRVSQPGAGYPMTYWMQFAGPAYGMHWGFIKPYPNTMGCVRLPLNTARKVFALVKPGTTKIHVATSQPWDATIGKQLPVLDDSQLPDPPMSYMLSPKVFEDADNGKMWTF